VRVASRCRSLSGAQQSQPVTDHASTSDSDSTAAGVREQDTGSWFPVPEEGELPAELRGLFAKARERLGFVPNVFRVYAFRPERLSAWFAHYRQLHESTEGLNAADREMIVVMVSAANGCLYCLVAHGAWLREELGDPVLGERVSYDRRRAAWTSVVARSVCSPRN
jgi:uncharacterized peroxidase-related enzyme